MKTPAILAILIALTGCAEGTLDAPSHFSFLFKIDPAMSPTDQEAVLGALDDWTAAASAANEECFTLRAEISDVSEKGATTVRTTDSSVLSHCLPADAAPGVYVAGCATVGGIILLRDHPFQRHTVAHEIGHIMGLGHNDHEDSVMWSYLNNTSPTAADAAAVCAGSHLR